MNKLLYIILFLLIISCKKKTTCENCQILFLGEPKNPETFCGDKSEIKSWKETLKYNGKTTKDCKIQ